MMPPPAPSSLSANPISGGQITLSWPASTDNVGVTRLPGGALPRGRLHHLCAHRQPLMTASYVDTGLSAGISYSYRIRAQDAVGNFSPYSPITTATTPTGTTLVAADNFDRADNLNLGAAWDPYTGKNALQLVGNSVRASGIGGDNVESYNAVPLSNNQWSQATLTGWNGTVYHNAHVSVRLSPNLATLTGYVGMVDSNNKAIIGKWTAGVFSVLASVPYTPGVGDILRMGGRGHHAPFLCEQCPPGEHDGCELRQWAAPALPSISTQGAPSAKCNWIILARTVSPPTDSTPPTAPSSPTTSAPSADTDHPELARRDR